MNTVRVTAPRSHPWYQRKRFWLLCLLAAFVTWLVLPATYSGGGIRFTIHYSGTPGSLTFIIKDSAGAPLPGVTVMSESFSGTTEEFITDATGVAVIRPGEAEVLAVRIAGREFRFRPQYSFFEHFAPDCSYRGLTFCVTIQ